MTEDARRLGLGRALAEAAIERARERGCRRVQLDVNEVNAEALALYRSLGFDSMQDPPGGNLHLDALDRSGLSHSSSGSTRRPRQATRDWSAGAR